MDGYRGAKSTPYARSELTGCSEFRRAAWGVGKDRVTGRNPHDLSVTATANRSNSRVGDMHRTCGERTALHYTYNRRLLSAFQCGVNLVPDLAGQRTHPRTRPDDKDGMFGGWLAQTAHA